MHRDGAMPRPTTSSKTYLAVLSIVCMRIDATGGPYAHKHANRALDHGRLYGELSHVLAIRVAELWLSIPMTCTLRNSHMEHSGMEVWQLLRNLRVPQVKLLQLTFVQTLAIE